MPQQIASSGGLLEVIKQQRTIPLDSHSIYILPTQGNRASFRVSPRKFDRIWIRKLTKGLGKNNNQPRQITPQAGTSDFHMTLAEN